MADGTCCTTRDRDNTPMPAILVMATSYHAAIEEFLPDVLEDRNEPARFFDFGDTLDQVPDGYRAMKVLIEF